MAYAARWAAEKGLVLDESLTLRDEGLSAYHQRHVKTGALGVFLNAVESGQVAPGSVLVVEALDRLSRAEPIQAQAQLAQIVNAGITVVTASDGKAYSREQLKANPMDLVYSLLVMIRAHEESDTKSKRVTAALRRQCENWLAGKGTGVIRAGKDPAWVRLVGDRWELVPERVEAVRVSLELYRKGYGASRIIDELEERGLHLTSRGAAALQIYRLLKQRALLGEKELTLDGEEFRLPGYYPALLTPEEWSSLQGLSGERGRRKVKGSVPHIITGMGITFCGYCGYALLGQTMEKRSRLPDGRIRDCHRRLRCLENFKGEGCKHGGSCSSAAIERAIIGFCSDMINLQALMSGDRGGEVRALVAKCRDRIAEIDQQLERLTDAMLASGGEAAPATFLKRARELETERTKMQGQLATAEHELSALARHDLAGKDDRWRQIATGVEMQEFDARMQARQLVADTFTRIVVWWKGMRPDACPPGTIDVQLLGKGGGGRLMRINKDGSWVAGEDFV